VLDVGGGAGYFSGALRASGASVVCVDVPRYRRRTGREPKNRFGSWRYPVSVGEGLRWARLREVVTWNLLLVLRKD